MTNQSPATPPQGATPGSVEQKPVVPSAASPQTPATTGTEGTQPLEEGKLVISKEEYARLQRDSARIRSFEKRVSFNKKKTPPTVSTDGQGGDQELVDSLTKSQLAQSEAENRALKAEIRLGVNEILAKPENAKLPDSFKDMIRARPHLLSEAENVEEALLDIEEFVLDAVNKTLPVENNVNPTQGDGSRTVTPETPPVVGGSNPAPAPALEDEDLSILSGMDRTRAAVRNALRSKQRGEK